MIQDRDKEQIRKRFEVLENPVELILFSQKVAAQCQFCEQTEILMKELAGLSDHLTLTERNFVTDQEDVKSYRIDKIPALVIQGSEDAGVRYFGVPAGYEFATLLDAITLVSKNEHGLSDKTIEQLQTLKSDIHIQVFVTPTCPYCPRAALTAFQLAMASPKITADVVEISEFPHLAQKYEVMGVPKVVINETHSFEGALPESQFVQHLLGL